MFEGLVVGDFKFLGFEFREAQFDVLTESNELSQLLKRPRSEYHELELL